MDNQKPNQNHLVKSVLADWLVMGFSKKLEIGEISDCGWAGKQEGKKVFVG